MTKWRWPTWGMVGATALYVVVVAALIAGSSDAHTAGYRSGQLLWVWAIAMGGFGYAWRSTKPKAFCPQCHSAVDPRAPFCAYCRYVPGTPVVPVGVCQNCHRFVAASSPSCPWCGFVPGSASAPPTQPPAAG